MLHTTKQRLLPSELEKAPDTRWPLLRLFVLVAIVGLDIDIPGNVTRLLHGFVAMTLHLVYSSRS
jgi:hypothetical protein